MKKKLEVTAMWFYQWMFKNTMDRVCGEQRRFQENRNYKESAANNQKVTTGILGIWFLLASLT